MTLHLTTALIDGRSVAAIGLDGTLYVPESLAGFSGAVAALDRWETVEPLLRGWTPDARDARPGARRTLPLAHPRKVLCSGPNYTDHLAEMGESGLGEGWTAYFFLKPPTTTLIADGDPVLVDDPARDRVDWEGELAVVIGRGGRRITVADALGHVAGYAVANDISLRGPHHRPNTPAAPFRWDWTASKAADTSLPLGPGVVPHWLVPDPQSLRIITSVNGEVRQDGTTADMVLDVAELVSQASALVTLEPGDVLLTGTPAGVGAARGVYLRPGDEVEVSIPGVGTIGNIVQQREEDSP